MRQQNRATRRKSLKNQEPEKVLYESKERYKPLKPLNQEQYGCIQTIRSHDLTLILGKPGAGKTAVACGVAAEYLSKGLIETIVLIRSIQGVGKSGGSLPGTSEEKCSPYASTMMGELNAFIDVKSCSKEGKIIFVPLEFIRGSTLKHSFVIIDEAQNMTKKELKVALSRFGYGSKFVVLADLEQSDLPPGDSESTARILDNLMALSERNDRIGFIELFENVRHPIIDALMTIF